LRISVGVGAGIWPPQTSGLQWRTRIVFVEGFSLFSSVVLLGLVKRAPAAEPAGVPVASY
jgi:hypothetical protein